MLRLLHTADTHLGYRQYHRREREDDFEGAFDRVIDDAIEEGVDAVVHAGDLFDSSRPGIGTLSAALDSLGRLAEAEIPFLSIVGNHDGTRETEWIDVFAGLGLATRLDREGIVLEAAGEESIHVACYGQDHVVAGQRDRLEYSFDRTTAEEADGAILVAHGLFEPFPNGDWDARAICRRSTVAFDAILAGDDHTRRETMLEDSGTLLTYPGSTERTAADQRAARGYNLLTVDSTGAISLEKRELDTREFVYIDVELETGEGSERVRKRVENEPGVANAVVVVTLTGEGERVASGPIEDAGLGRGALVVRVNDRRELDETRRDYGEVAFVDPDRAVQQRRETVGLSEGGREIETLVRDGEGVADSNLTAAVESRVEQWIDESAIDRFERSAPDPENETEETESSGADGEANGKTEAVAETGTTTEEADAEAHPTTNGSGVEAGDSMDGEGDDEQGKNDRTTQSTLWD